MKLAKVILEGPIEYDPDFNKQVDKIKDRGGVYIGSGDYGSVFLYNGKAVKVTTDSVELEHAQALEGKKSNNFVRIYNVDIIEPKLGIIEMDIMAPLNQEIPEEYYEALEKEAKRFGIDPEELDIKKDNFMQDPKSGKIKMVDV